MPTSALSTPNPSQVTISGQAYELLAFYYDGQHDIPWDNYYQVPYFGNFYPVKPANITVTFENVSGTFLNAEAAYQASKWWDQANIRTNFETLDGPDAFSYSTDLQHGNPSKKIPKTPPTSNYGGVGSKVAMRRILDVKYAIPEFRAALKSTNAAYLLEHDKSVRQNPSGWSDNNDGLNGGDNNLGIMLMEIRGSLFGTGYGAPGGTYQVSDFSKAVLPHP